jgi:hypothetical protein
VLVALRTRAGTVLAAASISGSFLGTKVSHGSLDAWAILAFVAFVLCVGVAIYVLLPHALVFSFRGQDLLAASDHEGIGGVTEAYRTAGIWIEPILESNRDKIADLSDWFAVSFGLLAVEVILWTISLASKPRPWPRPVPRILPPRSRRSACRPSRLPVAFPEKRGGLFGGHK